MILELDIGNTRIKWRLLGLAIGVADSTGAVCSLEELDNDIKPNLSVEKIRAACVRKGKIVDEISAWAGQRWGLDIEVARVINNHGGLTLKYADLTRLGVDRWLAMLAAYNISRSACAVVDCGTAVTVDFIEESGHHRGGYIIPGLQLFAKSLTENTAIRLSNSVPVYDFTPGNSTESAVYNGSLATILAMIEVTVRKEFDLSPAANGHSIYITGGDAQLIAGFLTLTNVNIKLVSELVFDGLSIALP